MTVLGIVKKNKSRLMSLDPSINNCGMAIWDMATKNLIARALLHPKKGNKDNEYDKSESILEQIREFIKMYGITHMILEVPEHWAVAGFEARETGSIAKLCFVCGMIYSLKNQLEEFKVVVPRGWKGQLPKEVVANRLQEEYMTKYDIDMQKMDKNVMDAIGIGHFRLFGKV
jgi:hypothetical protein